MSPRARSLIAAALLVAGSLLLAVGLAALYVDRRVLDEDRFADAATRALHEPAVRREVARRVGDAAVRADVDLIAARAVIEAGTETLLETRALDPVLREAAVEVHRLALSRTAGNVFLDVADAEAALSSFVGRRFGLHLPVRGRPLRVAAVDADGIGARLARLADDLRLGLWLLPLGAACLIGAVLAAPGRRRALRRAGYGVAAAGVGLVVLEAALRVFVARGLPERDAVAEALGVFVGPLFWWGAATIAIGAGIALATTRLAEIQEADRLVVVALRMLGARPERASWRVVHGLAVLALGTALILEPLTVLRLLGVALGVLLVLDGILELARLAGSDALGPARPSHRRRLVAAVLAVPLVLAVPALAFDVARPGVPAAVDDRLCNGARELCHRPLDRVALPAAHNAMSSADASFTDPNQRRTIVEQLDAGVRGLLIDSKLARPTDRPSVAVTVLEDKAQKSAYEQLGPAGTAALQDLIERGLAAPKGAPKPYLCHIVCELGATRMVEALRGVRTWLERHPDEVIVIVIEDLLTPRATEEVFKESGLYYLVHTQVPGALFPTLRELIDADRRVVVMAEKHGFPGGWYQPGYERLLKETPYANPTVASLRSDASCRPNRGREANPLFLVNHWVAVYPPRPSRAVVVNERSFLLARVRRCEHIRQAFPNLIAVDFASVGDVVGAARAVNGLDPASRP